MTLWAARTGVALDPDVDVFLRAEDDELLPYDCAATAVHAQRLHAVGILDDGELADVETRLGTIAEEGRLFLQIIPSPWNNGSTGTYRVRIETAIAVVAAAPK